MSSKKSRLVKVMVLLAILLSEIVDGSLVAAENDYSIFGTWKGPDESGKVGTLIFMQGGDADFIIDDESMREMALKTHGSLTLSMNADVKPSSIDVIATTGDGAIKVLKGIIEFVDRDDIRVRFSFDSDERPTEFTESNHGTLTLHREMN